MAEAKVFFETVGLDDETVEYILGAVADTDAGEWPDLLDGFVEPDHVEGALSALNAAFPDIASAAPAVDTTGQDGPVLLSSEVAGTLSTGGDAQAPPDVVTKKEPVVDSSAHDSSSGGDDEPGESKSASKVSPKSKRRKDRKAKKGKGKQKAKAKDTTEDPTRPHVEIISRLSRFDKELGTTDTAFTEVVVEGVCVSVNDREIISEASLHFECGRRYGFIGQNGSGKSTLLRAMADGTIPGWPTNWRTILVDQEDVGDERTSLETVLAADQEIVRLRLREKALAIAAEDGSADTAKRAILQMEVIDRREDLRLAELSAVKTSGQRGFIKRGEAQKAIDAHEAAIKAVEDASDGCGEQADILAVIDLLNKARDTLQQLDADAKEAEAMIVLRGLGFSEDLIYSPTQQLSGGWRMRTAIARALVTKPDCLLLDEPTNHLDWPALLWLEEHLKSPVDERIMILVSHDRAFLDAVVTDIARLSEQKITYYVGNYSHFEDALNKEKEDRANYAARRQKKIDDEWTKVRRLEAEGRKRNDANLLNQVSSRKKKLGIGTSHNVTRVGAERDQDGKRFKIFTQTFDSVDDGSKQAKLDDTVSIKIPAADDLGYFGALLQCRQLVFGWNAATPLSQPFDLDITLKSRIAIVGMNGSGKSTLIKTIAGELEPVRGEVFRYARLSVGYFSQHVTDSIPTNKTAVQAMKFINPQITEQEARSKLGSFGIRQQATTRVGNLSGGEKTRVALASLTYKPPHILLLDEPTNHLDLNTVKAMSEALLKFEGGIVLVSHDRRLIDALKMDCYQLHDGKFIPCTLRAFLGKVLKKRK